MKYAPIALVTVAVLSGCTAISTKNIEAFGLATADVTSKIDAVINDYNQANVNDQLVMMAQSNQKFVKSDMDPIKKIIIRDSDKKGFSLYKANDALGKYAAALTDLSNAGSHEELAIAGVKLSKSLKEMNAQYKVLNNTNDNLMSDENSGKISRVITEISSYYVEYKRAKALKEVIVSANPAIQKIGKVISNELLKGVVEERLYTMKGNELAGYFDDYNAKVDNMSFLQKKKALDDIYGKYIVMESTTATVIQAEKAILSVTQAHNEFAVELENDNFDSESISAAIQNIKTVHKSFDDLEELMSSCETEIIADEEKGIICK